MSSRPDVDILVQGVMSKIKTPISNKYFKPSVAGPGLPSYKALEELEEQYPSCGIKIYNKLLKDSGAVYTPGYQSSLPEIAFRTAEINCQISKLGFKIRKHETLLSYKSEDDKEYGYNLKSVESRDELKEYFRLLIDKPKEEERKRKELEKRMAEQAKFNRLMMKRKTAKVPIGNLLGLSNTVNTNLLKFPSRENELAGLFDSPKKTRKNKRKNRKNI